MVSKSIYDRVVFRTLTNIYDGEFYENKAFNYFFKTLHRRYLTRFWIRLCKILRRERLPLSCWKFSKYCEKMFARIRRKLPVSTGSSKHCNIISTGNNVTFFQATWKVQYWEKSITSNTVPTLIYTVNQSNFR